MVTTVERATIVSLIPAFIRSRIAHRPNLVKIIDNIGWLIFDKILRMGVGLFVWVWIARYLGPEGFGLLNFATAFVGLFGAIAALGLQGIVVRDIVREPENASLTMGTAAVLHLLGGVAAFLLILGAIAYLRPDDALARTIVAILGATLLFKAGEIAAYWFESQVQSKYTAWVQNGVFLVFAAIKVGMIVNQAPLSAFVWAMLAEAALAALILMIVMSQRGQSFTSLRATAERARTLLKDSWPLILSAIAVSVYMRIDQIMLGQMIGDEAVGIYSAAVKISEVWYFVPMAIAASAFPSIIETRTNDIEGYYRQVQSLYDVMVIIALFIAIPTSFFSGNIVKFVFGLEYTGSAAVLSISIWAGIAVAMSYVHGKWLLAENLQRYVFVYTVTGAILNSVLNLLLIPKYGPIGAAWATLCAQFIPIMMQVLIPRSRQNLVMMMRALAAPVRFSLIIRSYVGGGRRI